MSTTATRDLKTVLADLTKIQKEYEGKAMPADVGTQFETLAKEAKEIQDAQDRAKLVAELEAKSREIPSPALPRSGDKTREGEAKEQAGSPDEVVGYLSLGDVIAHNEEFKALHAANFPQGTAVRIDVASLRGLRAGARKEVFVPVSRKARDGMLETKATATIASLVVPRDRIADVVRSVEQTRLTIRDVLNVAQTTSNMVEYLTLTPSTPAAAPTAESAVKPETTLAMALATAPVRTIPITMPVTEQQLQDVPALRNAIDTELLYQLDFVEEQQLVWGSGTGENLLGIFNTSGVTAGRTVSGDTIIDQIRRAMTDINLNFLTPNAVCLHPLDYEAALLTKATTGEYIFVVMPTSDGGDRVWSLRIVETVAMQKPTTAGSVFERRFLVGDFVRGATLWDRQQAQIAIGWINDQFVRNQRTVRAEQREAFGVKRPGAFKYRITLAES